MFTDEAALDLVRGSRRERDEALKVRDLARVASNRDLEAKRAAEAELARVRAEYGLLLYRLDGLEHFVCDHEIPLHIPCSECEAEYRAAG